MSDLTPGPTAGPRRPRRVLHVILAAAGGAARSTLGLIQETAKAGVESVLACGSAGVEAGLASQLREAVAGRVLEVSLYTWNRKTRALWWKRPLLELRQGIRTGGGVWSGHRVAEFAREQEVDLVHSSSILVVEGARAARALGLPHVWHLRELVGPGCPFRLPLEGAPLGEFLASRASKVIANSAAAGDRVAGWLPEGLLEVVPNGIDVAAFRDILPGGREPAVVVGMVGSLSSRSKNHVLFLEAAALVRSETGVAFKIFGDDPDDAYSRDLRERVDRLGLGERLQFMGYHPNPVEVMRQIDVLVHPSAGESFGRVVVEAMAAGRPAIGVRGGGVAGIVADGLTGFLVAPGDSGELAERIRMLVESPEMRHSMGAEGRRQAEARFSVEVCARRVMGVYEDAMARPLGVSQEQVQSR